MGVGERQVKSYLHTFHRVHRARTTWRAAAAAEERRRLQPGLSQARTGSKSRTPTHRRRLATTTTTLPLALLWSRPSSRTPCHPRQTHAARRALCSGLVGERDQAHSGAPVILLLAAVRALRSACAATVVCVRLFLCRSYVGMEHRGCFTTEPHKRHSNTRKEA